MTLGSHGIAIHGLADSALLASMERRLGAALAPLQHAAETSRPAFDEAFRSLERQIERYRERDRDNRRHPKKYYAARLLLQGGRPLARTPPRGTAAAG